MDRIPKANPASQRLRTEPERSSIEGRIAVILTWTVRVGLFLVIAAFTLYLSGVRPAAPAAREVPSAWELSARDYAEALDRRTGWAWVDHRADAGVISFAALILFPTAAVGVMIAAAVLFGRSRNRVYAALCTVEALILILAAAGLFAR